MTIRSTDLTLVRGDHPAPIPQVRGQWALPLTDGANALALDAPPRPDVRVGPPPVRLRAVEDEDLAARGARLVQAVLEVQAGTRPLGQLARVLRTDVHDQLQRRLTLLARTRRPRPTPPPRARVASARAYQPHPDAAEISVRVVQDGRSRAVAARIEYDRERREPTWVCTAFCWS
ncbi:hypothetical protein CLV56_2798 [Mumia flava]|uniref:Uncharacterized protein n=1 Tax=Mumia flava TaxID=1348852 RepID=A0A0B2BNK9_9ACTN|nr:Rv3235 family protein [Mumia flava]PJJ58547.1 hypothetical protein CLV56_2798 [Mumia flava]